MGWGKYGGYYNNGYNGYVKVLADADMMPHGSRPRLRSRLCAAEVQSWQSRAVL